MMAILSDEEIRLRIAADGLVVGADPARASECSYSFVSGAAFHPGRTEPATVFPGEVVVRPGEMIWIRTRERVKIPRDLVGFWWQTNSLSRRGLMLVNMSMVEPGYEGDLACLFVNFGKASIPIDGKTIIAKMVFGEISGHVLHAIDYRSDRATYDAQLRELSINQPPSFLQIGELAANLDAQRQQAIAAINSAAMTGAASASKQAIDDFKADIPKAVRQSAVWALGALALLTAASVGSDWIKGNLFPDVAKTARAEAEHAVRDRLTVTASPRQDDPGQLAAEVKRLQARIDALEKRKP